MLTILLLTELDFRAKNTISVPVSMFVLTALKEKKTVFEAVLLTIFGQKPSRDLMLVFSIWCSFWM